MSAENRPWTQQPWHYQEESDAYTHIVRGSKGEIVLSAPQGTSGEDEANARLGAAAPALYEALAVVVSPLEHLEGCLHRDNPRMCCQCGYNDRINEAVANARAALSAALPK